MKDNDILGAVRESLDAVHLDRPVETVMAAGRARRRRTMAIRTSIASLAIAALGTGALVLNGIGAPPVSDGGAGPGGESRVLARTAQYSMVRNLDGSITFTVNDMFDPAAATTALNNAGITGRVVILGADQACPTTSADINPTDLYPDETNTRAFGRRGPSTATFRTSDYPVGGGLMLVLIDLKLPARGDRPRVDTGPPVVFVLAFDDAAKIPTCLNADVDS